MFYSGEEKKTNQSSNKNTSANSNLGRTRWGYARRGWSPRLLHLLLRQLQGKQKHPVMCCCVVVKAASARFGFVWRICLLLRCLGNDWRSEKPHLTEAFRSCWKCATNSDGSKSQRSSHMYVFILMTRPEPNSLRKMTEATFFFFSQCLFPALFLCFTYFFSFF